MYLRIYNSLLILTGSILPKIHSKNTAFCHPFFRRVNCKIKRKINNLSRCFKAMKKPDNKSQLFSYYFKESEEMVETNKKEAGDNCFKFALSKRS